MRKIELTTVTQKIKELFIDACSNLPENVLNCLKQAQEKEQSPLCKDVFKQTEKLIAKYTKRLV